jgi:hypothetical protein
MRDGESGGQAQFFFERLRFPHRIKRNAPSSGFHHRSTCPPFPLIAIRYVIADERPKVGDVKVNAGQ